VDPALWELLRAEAGTDGDQVLEAVIRLARPGLEIPGVRMVARFGTIATCRIRARDVIAVRARPDVISIKAAHGLSPGFEPAASPPDHPSAAPPSVCPADLRRGPELGLTGAGVVVAAIDWGVDFDSAAFRWPADRVAAGGNKPGGTRLLAFWDQRDQAAGPPPERYGYGSVHDREEIDRALQDPRPYQRLGYHPAIADPRGRGAHGTRTLDIAAGNGETGGPAGIAPDADLIFVHLADRNTGGLANFGDSVRLLEAVDFISRTAGQQPCAINISAGRLCGPRDGTTLVERAFDELVSAVPGRFIVDSAGNYFRWRAHACGTLAPGETRSLTVVVDPADITFNELEIWYDGADEFAVRVDPPGYATGRPVCLGERSDLLIDGRVAGRVYHRKHDPNNGDNHIVVYLDPVGRAGEWTVTLEARRVRGGRFHAWIERDDSCPGCQARFAPDDSDPATTIGSIATSHLPLIVGAYDGHDPDRPVATFSSAGPCRDGRGKPDLVAPGVGVLATRSAPVGADHSPGLLVRGNGTSFATPHVTGAVALCFEAAGHRLSASQIRSLVLESCDAVRDADPQGRLGRGYLNIARLVADVRQAMAAPAGLPTAKEPALAAEDVIMLAAAPATAYREYLYRPQGQFARWIRERFDVVGRPGQRLDHPPEAGDVLLEVTLGRRGPGRCLTLEAGGPQLAAVPPRLAPGQLLLRPLKRAELSDPLPVEPDLGAPDLAFLTAPAERAAQGGEPGAG
jgi:subtilisin family serine protease